MQSSSPLSPSPPSTLALVSENFPPRLLRNRKIVKKINHVSKHFHFYASVNLQNISGLGIKNLLHRKLQIGLYGETQYVGWCRGGELPSVGGNYSEMWSHCLEPPLTSHAGKRCICFSGPGNVIS